MWNSTMRSWMVSFILRLADGNFVFRVAFSSWNVTSVLRVPDLTKADRNRGGGGWSKLSIRHFTALLCCNKVWRTHHPLSLYYAQWCNCNLHILNRFHTFHAKNARHCHFNSALKPFFLIKVRSWFKRLFLCVFDLHTFSQKNTNTKYM